MYTIDTTLTYDWATYCGIPGGIPDRDTIYQTMTTANTIAQINAAIAACPVGQVVALAAGTYSISGISRKSGITIRGAGAGKTIINSGSSTAFNYTGSSFNYDSGHQAIASGYVKGSLSVTLSTTPGAQFVVGRLIMINQDDDHVLVFPRTGNWAGTRNLRHVSRITNITGNTITFSSPLPYTYAAGQNPGAQAIPCYDSLFGIEGMTIDAASGVRFLGSDRCWVKDCEIKGFDNEGIFVRDSHQIEIRRCYLHDCDGFPTQADGYGLYAQYAVSCLKMEDCIGYHIAYGTVMNGNDSSAYLYNYMLHMGRDAATRFWQQPGFNCNHGPHSMMNLWEGNMAERWQNDAYHGSASHQTLFRNHIHGVNPAYTLDRRIMDFCRTSYYFNSVGNIIGDASWNPNYYDYPATAYDRNHGTMYLLGWPNMGSGSLTAETTLTGFTPPGGSYPDTNVAATLIRHANYDYYNDAVQYSDADHDIADSLFYTEKPSWFGSLTFPPIDPFTPTANQTPAKYRWDTYAASADLDDLFAEAPSSTYWVSPTGAATWQNANSESPLSGAACCSLATANTNAHAGDIVYLRGGTYAISGAYKEAVKPANSGTSEDDQVVFAAYTGETPIIDGSASTSSWGLAIINKSYIKIDGLHFKNFSRWADIRAGSHYNEITNCEFYSDTGEDGSFGLRIIEDCVGGESFLCPSTNNWVHGNTFHTLHSPLGILKEGADLVRIGQANDVGDSEFGCDNNTIEDNVIYHAGHACFDGYGLYTVFKNNILHNEPWWDDDSVGATTTLTADINAGSTTIYVTSTAPIAQADSSGGYATIGDERISYTGRTSTSLTGCGRGKSGTVAESHSSGDTLTASARYRSDMYTDTDLREKFGHRVFQITDGGKRDGIYSLIEGNRFGYAGNNPNNNGADNVDIAGPRNIIRRNYIYGSMNSGLLFKYGWVETAGGHGGTYNKVYNNTIYKSGYGNPRYELSDDAISTAPEGLLAIRFYQAETYGNVIKNNLIYDSRRYALSGFEIGFGAATSTTPDETVLDTNWLTYNGDPGFIDPTLGNYSSLTLPDLRLGTGSGCINSGTHLTLASGSGSSSVTLVVDDASYFQDGTWGSALTHGVTLFPDQIAIGTVENTVAISSIDYDTNTITLDSAMTWADNAPVWLYMDSSGTRVLYGTAPEIGADAYVPGVPIGFINDDNLVRLTISENEVAKLYVDYAKRRAVTGTSVTYSVHASPYNDFAGNITLDITGLPTNATDSYSVNPITETGSSIATVTTTGVAAGTYEMYITGTSAGGDVASVRVILEIVESADADIKVPFRHLRAKRGDDAVFTIEADALSGYTSDTDLSVSGVPSGASASFGDSSLAYNASTTMTIDTGTAAAGEYILTITGEGPA